MRKRASESMSKTSSHPKNYYEFGRGVPPVFHEFADSGTQTDETYENSMLRRKNEEKPRLNFLGDIGKTHELKSVKTISKDEKKPLADFLRGIGKPHALKKVEEEPKAEKKNTLFDTLNSAMNERRSKLNNSSKLKNNSEESSSDDEEWGE